MSLSCKKELDVCENAPKLFLETHEIVTQIQIQRIFYYFKGEENKQIEECLEEYICQHSQGYSGIGNRMKDQGFDTRDRV